MESRQGRTFSSVIDTPPTQGSVSTIGDIVMRATARSCTASDEVLARLLKMTLTVMGTAIALSPGRQTVDVHAHAK
jgi:hypothetical protein